MDLDLEKAAAQQNFDLLVKCFPERLAEREHHFADRVMKAKLSPGRKLETLYDFMNELFQAVYKFTPCKKGCDSCCHYPVSISEIEIQHIEKRTGRKRNSAFLLPQNFHGTPCPFLVNRTCSIYSARPFACRQHVTLTKTNTWCAPQLSNDEEFPILQFSGLNDAFDHIRRESNSYTVYDIRQAFG